MPSHPRETFRMAEPRDVETITRYHHQCWLSAFAPIVTSDVMDFILSRPIEPMIDGWHERLESNSGFTTVVAVDEHDAPVGHIMLEGHEVVHLFIDPNQQGRGLGRRLLALGEGLLNEAGHLEAELHTIVGNAPAVALYESCGWILTDETLVEHLPNGSSYTEHIMRKHLAPRPDHWRPDRPIEILAGTPQGGGQDRAARSIASALEPILDVPIFVTNVPGRGGGNAWDRLETHRGDGHVLSISSATLVTNHLTGVAGFGHEGLSQLALLCTEYIAFAVPGSSRLATGLDLLGALSESDPPTVSLAVARGNINHIALSYLCRHVGTDPRGVDIRVFDFARGAIADASERPDGIAAVSVASLLPETQERSFRLLATSAPARLAEPFADVPTWTELGVDCSIGTWRGLVGAPALAAEAVSFWDDAITSAVSTTEWQTSLSTHHWTNSYLASGDTENFMRREEQGMQSGLRSLGLLGDS